MILHELERPQAGLVDDRSYCMVYDSSDVSLSINAMMADSPRASSPEDNGVDRAIHRCIGVEMASSSRSGVTAVRGSHASYACSVGTCSTGYPSFGHVATLKPSPIECRNDAPNGLHEADCAMLLVWWVCICIGSLMARSLAWVWFDSV